MANLGNTTRPAYVYDAETDTWLPIGVGAHSHDYTTQFIGKTLVDAKGDIVTASASDTPAILSKGADGTILVADSTTSTGLAWQPYAAQFVAGKNCLLNGDFSIAQRGTSIVTNGDTYTLDRWSASPYGGSTNFTVSQQTSSPPTNSRYYLQVVHGSTSYTNMFITQSLETTDVIKLRGKTVTLSFQYKVPTNFTNQWSANAWWGTSIDTPIKNVNTGTSIFQTMLPNVNGWTTSSATFVVPSTATQLSIMFASLNNVISGATFQLATVQLEVGSTATPFTTATGTIQGELAACQRYYYRTSNSLVNNAQIGGIGFTYSTTNGVNSIPLPVTMRSIPHTLDYSGLRAYDITAASVLTLTSAVINGDSTPNVGTYVYTLNSTTANKMIRIDASSTAGYIGFNAEL